MSLARPSVDLYGMWLEAHLEWGPGLHEDGFGIGDEDDVDSEEGFAVWVGRSRLGPGERWWIVDGATLLGGIALRAADDPRAAEHGHVGYGVRPSARRRGVARWALGRVKEIARSAGRESITLVCLVDNVASIRTIERCGGHPAEPVHGGLAQRFVIQL